EWLEDRRNARIIPHRFEAVGYVPVRNRDNAKGFWSIKKVRQVIYAKSSLSLAEQFQAAAELKRDREKVAAGPNGQRQSSTENTESTEKTTPSTKLLKKPATNKKHAGARNRKSNSVLSVFSVPHRRSRVRPR